MREVTQWTQGNADEVQKLDDEATPGPWLARGDEVVSVCGRDGVDMDLVTSIHDPDMTAIFAGDRKEADAAWSAYSRTALPAARTEIERLREHILDDANKRASILVAIAQTDLARVVEQRDAAISRTEAAERSCREEHSAALGYQKEAFLQMERAEIAVRERDLLAATVRGMFSSVNVLHDSTEDALASVVKEFGIEVLRIAGLAPSTTDAPATPPGDSGGH